MSELVLVRGATAQELDFFDSPCSDDFVKSRKTPFFVIPAKAGIQSIQGLMKALDSGFHRSDDFLRVHHVVFNEIFLTMDLYFFWKVVKKA